MILNKFCDLSEGNDPLVPPAFIEGEGSEWGWSDWDGVDWDELRNIGPKRHHARS